MARTQEITEAMKNLGFGTELEYEHISREKAAKAVQSVVGGTIRHTGGTYDTWTVTAEDGREWKAVSDGSLSDRMTSAEVVTPILKWDDLGTLKEVVRALRRAGAKAEATTSQHVHVGVQHLNAKQIGNIAKTFYKYENLILKALGTRQSRLNGYTKPTDPQFIERLCKTKPRNRITLNRVWYGYQNPHPSHYDGSRYHDLNLNNLFYGTGTVEFRAANGSLDAREVMASTVLCLAIVAKAMTAKAASAKNKREYDEATAKYDMRVTLINLGLNGDEFKSVRKHLLKRMPGNAAWKHGRPNA